MATTGFKTIDEYIASFPEEDQKVLQKIRTTIQKAAPDAEEIISYQMPTVRLKKILIQISPYLTFNGNCREAMTFYKDCLSADRVTHFGKVCIWRLPSQ